MARKFTSLLLILSIAGCGSNGGLVGNIPSPNFNGPVVQSSVPAPLTHVPPPAVQPVPNRPGLPSERAWVPRDPARPWRWIVIHHSATPAGGAASIDRAHRARGFDELGYHFVIGNGTDTRNGLVEVGPRWTIQKIGAHDNAGDNRYNEYGIGICLVGNFEIERPTPAQMQSLAKLTAYLMRTYNISSSNIIGHGQTKSTECPGRNLSVAVVRRMATQALADAGESIIEDEARPAAGTELLGDLSEPGLLSK